MKPNYKKAFSLLFVVLFFTFLFQVLTPLRASAGLFDTQEGFGTDGSIQKSFGHGLGTDPGDMRVIIAKIIRVFLGFIGIILVILLLLAGYKWMTANGEEAKVTESKNTIRNAVIGIIIVTMAFGITQFILSRIYDISTN